MALLVLLSLLLSSSLSLRSFCDHSVHRMRIGWASDSKSDARPMGACIDAGRRYIINRLAE
jgi:hypothetical protein